MECVSVPQAAKIKGVTRQAIYLAIKLKRLRAYKHGDRWRIFIKDLRSYDITRWKHSFYEGRKIYDEENGVFSIEKAAEMINVPKQKLYYAARMGRLKAYRKGAAWIVSVHDLFVYEDEYLKKKVVKKGVA